MPLVHASLLSLFFLIFGFGHTAAVAAESHDFAPGFSKLKVGDTVVYDVRQVVVTGVTGGGDIRIGTLTYTVTAKTPDQVTYASKMVTRPEPAGEKGKLTEEAGTFTVDLKPPVGGLRLAPLFARRTPDVVVEREEVEASVPMTFSVPALKKDVKGDKIQISSETKNKDGKTYSEKTILEVSAELPAPHIVRFMYDAKSGKDQISVEGTYKGDRLEPAK